MLKKLLMLGVLAALTAGPVAFADEKSEMEGKCRQWAQEEQVDGQDLEEYVADCVKSLAEEGER